MQPPDYPLSCSHTDHSHLRGPDPQCGRAEGCQCGLCYGPGAAPRGPAHSHHHHLEAAAEQRTVKLQSECSPLHLDVCTPMDSVRTWALQGLPALAARQSPGKPRALKHISLRCNPQCGSAWVLWAALWTPTGCGREGVLSLAGSILEPSLVPQGTADTALLVPCRYLSSHSCQSSASSLTSC